MFIFPCLPSKICYFSNKEFLGRIQLIFPGVKEFKCVSLNNDLSGNDNLWEINQIVNFYDETIELPTPVNFLTCIPFVF